MDAQAAYDLKFLRFLRFDSFQIGENWIGMRQVLLPNLNILDGIGHVNNFDPLVPRRYVQWMQAVDQLEASIREGWLAYYGVNWILRTDSSQALGVGFDPVVAQERWKWYPCIREVQTEEEAWQALERDFQAAPFATRSMIVETGRGAGQPTCAAQDGVSIQLIEQSSEQVIFDLNTPVDGWFQLRETWYPGWQVNVDAARADLYPADFLFKAVFVAKGVHRVKFFYRPSGFYFGALFSILVLLCVFFLSVRKREHRNSV
jgi:hypothetical protein